jgi:hypothetical protein
MPPKRKAASAAKAAETKRVNQVKKLLASPANRRLGLAREIPVLLPHELEAVRVKEREHRRSSSAGAGGGGTKGQSLFQMCRVEKCYQNGQMRGREECVREVDGGPPQVFRRSLASDAGSSDGGGDTFRFVEPPRAVDYEFYHPHDPEDEQAQAHAVGGYGLAGLAGLLHGFH